MNTYTQKNKAFASFTILQKYGDKRQVLFIFRHDGIFFNSWKISWVVLQWYRQLQKTLPLALDHD